MRLITSVSGGRRGWYETTPYVWSDTDPFDRASYETRCLVWDAQDQDGEVVARVSLAGLDDDIPQLLGEG